MTLQQIADCAMDYLDSMNIPASYEVNRGLDESPSVTVLFHETSLQFDCQWSDRQWNHFSITNTIRDEVSRINRMGVNTRCFSRL